MSQLLPVAPAGTQLHAGPCMQLSLQFVEPYAASAAPAGSTCAGLLPSPHLRAARRVLLCSRHPMQSSPYPVQHSLVRHSLVTHCLVTHCLVTRCLVRRLPHCCRLQEQGPPTTTPGVPHAQRWTPDPPAPFTAAAAAYPQHDPPAEPLLGEFLALSDPGGGYLATSDPQGGFYSRTEQELVHQVPLPSLTETLLSTCRASFNVARPGPRQKSMHAESGPTSGMSLAAACSCLGSHEFEGRPLPLHKHTPAASFKVSTT